MLVMRSALAVTIACLGCAALYTTARVLGRSNARNRVSRGRSRYETGALTLFLRDPAYRREWWRELCNVYRRMEILRRRNLLHHGIFLTSGEERHALGLPTSENYRRARIRSSRSLLTIHPEATLVDRYLVMTVIGPDLFAEDWDTAAVSARGRTGTR